MVAAATASGRGTAGKAGLAMKRILFLMLLLCTANARASNVWDNLWRNADQQGEKLMRQGNAAAAAKTFNDPRHKAYAELQAGDYSNAAKHFSAFDDSNGDYNRGNALAQAGQLEEALKAYDAALAHDPKDSDARYNRDLVARALQKQQPKSSSNKDSSSKDSKNGDKKQAGQSGQPDDKNSGKKDGSQSNSANRNSSGQDQNGKENQGKAGQGNVANGSEPKAGQGQQQTSQSGQTATKNQPDSSAPANGQSQPDDAAQAKRDAEAALGKSPTGKTGAMPDTPVSEQQLAQEQWLRRIPDDPGGLLRRKFMIEHMIRQQGGQQ